MRGLFRTANNLAGALLVMFFSALTIFALYMGFFVTATIDWRWIGFALGTSALTMIAFFLFRGMARWAERD
jgi:hypothetical protein